MSVIQKEDIRVLNIANVIKIEECKGQGGVVQWLKLPVWKVGDRGFKPRSGIRFQNFSALLTRKTKYCGEPP